MGQPDAARASVQWALLLGQAIGAVAPIYVALEAYALMLADGGDPARGRALVGDTATVVQGVLAELGADAAVLNTIDRRQVCPPAVEPYCQAVQAA